jgi:hypothetical protein
MLFVPSGILAHPQRTGGFERYDHTNIGHIRSWGRSVLKINGTPPRSAGEQAGGMKLQNTKYRVQISL